MVLALLMNEALAALDKELTLVNNQQNGMVTNDFILPRYAGNLESETPLLYQNDHITVPDSGVELCQRFG